MLATRWVSASGLPPSTSAFIRPGPCAARPNSRRTRDGARRPRRAPRACRRRRSPGEPGGDAGLALAGDGAGDQHDPHVLTQRHVREPVAQDAERLEFGLAGPRAGPARRRRPAAPRSARRGRRAASIASSVFRRRSNRSSRKMMIRPMTRPATPPTMASRLTLGADGEPGGGRLDDRCAAVGDGAQRDDLLEALFSAGGPGSVAGSAASSDCSLACPATSWAWRSVR